MHERPDLGDPGEALVDAVLSASRVLAAVTARSLGDVADGVTLTQYRTLVVLAVRGAQNLAGLADAMGVAPSTATRMCDRLVRKGLIRRTDEERDRRQLRVVLTKRGRTLIDAVSATRRRKIQAILSAVTPREQLALAEALGRFAAAAGEVPDQAWTTGRNVGGSDHGAVIVHDGVQACPVEVTGLGGDLESSCQIATANTSDIDARSSEPISRRPSRSA